MKKENFLRRMVKHLTGEPAISPNRYDKASFTAVVSCALLYRLKVPPEDHGPGSGKAVCVREKDGTMKILGFHSFGKDPDNQSQYYEDEDAALCERIEAGNAAFYGAFPVPTVMIDEHTICT